MLILLNFYMRELALLAIGRILAMVNLSWCFGACHVPVPFQDQVR